MDETYRPSAKGEGTTAPGGSTPHGTSVWWETSSIGGSSGPHGNTGGAGVGASTPGSTSAGSGGGSLVTALQRVMEQCDARGLTPTAQWLAELLLAASPSLLQQTSCNFPLVPNDAVLEGQPKTLAVLGRALLLNREYTRCHDLLKGAIPSAASTLLDGGHVQSHPAGGASTAPRPRTFGGRSVSSIRPCEWGTDDEGPAAGSINATGGGGDARWFDDGTSPHLQQRATAAGGGGGHQQDNAWRRLSEGGASSSVGIRDGPSPGPGEGALGEGAGTTAPPPAGACGPLLRGAQLAFIALYAVYMEGQQQRAVSAIASRAQSNPNLRPLRTLLQGTLEWYPHDPYLRWLHAVVLRESQLKQEAASELIHAVRLNPLLVCAWQDLSTLVTKESQLSDITAALRGLTRPDAQLMFRVFAATAREDLGLHATAAADWEGLLALFPTSSFLKCHAGNCMYHRKDFDRARALYDDVRHADPYRLEGTDDYSNLLFVRGDRIGLSVLAQQCYCLDPYRAETNCIVGNYYAIISRHDKSLFHFRRAVHIDPTYLSGWTLMGHEYLEMKNTSAAVEAYRAAIEIDQRDYRAWYGLGQIYELLHMHHHALYYYWQTTTLRPTDPRMWSAVANCLEQDRRPHEAVLCLERAEQYEPSMSDHYPSLVRRIAEHHLSTSGVQTSASTARAVAYLEKLVACERRKPEDLGFALPVLIDAHLADIHDAFNIPTRSPSFDPNQHVGASRGSGQQAAGLPPRESIGLDLRVFEATRKLDQCEGYLNLFMGAMAMPLSGEAAGGGADAGGVTLDQAQQYFAKSQSSILYVRSFLAMATNRQP